MLDSVCLSADLLETLPWIGDDAYFKQKLMELRLPLVAPHHPDHPICVVIGSQRGIREQTKVT